MFAIHTLTLAAVIFSSAANGQTLSKETRKDVLYAIKDEAFSYLRYKVFAEQARANGNTALADLFDATAQVEFDKHFRSLAWDSRLVKSDKENLTAAISDEYLETEKMYRDMANRAEAAGDSAMAQRFSDFGKDEEEHHRIFKEVIAKRSANAAN